MHSYQRDVEELKTALTDATMHRGERADFDAATGELGWVLHERNVMHDVTNRLRARYGAGPVTVQDIFTAEMRAAGHIDYVQKFALGCADVVHRPESERAS